MKHQTFVDILLEIKDLLTYQKTILNINELCNYTGYEKSYVYKLTSRKKIPHYKTPRGKSIFFKKVEIDDWLTRTKVKTLEEINTDAREKTEKIFKKYP